MTRKLTCFLASIGPSQTPITILSLASSAAACHSIDHFFYMFLEKSIHYFFTCFWIRKRRKSSLLIYYKLVINKQKEVVFFHVGSTTSKNKQEPKEGSTEVLTLRRHRKDDTITKGESKITQDSIPKSSRTDAASIHPCLVHGFRYWPEPDGIGR